jgi:hypothetical protein
MALLVPIPWGCHPYPALLLRNPTTPLALLVGPLPSRALEVDVQISVLVDALMVGFLPLFFSCVMNLAMLLHVASNGSRKTSWVCTMMVVF